MREFFLLGVLQQQNVIDNCVFEATVPEDGRLIQSSAWVFFSQFWIYYSKDLVLVGWFDERANSPFYEVERGYLVALAVEVLARLIEFRPKVRPHVRQQAAVRQPAEKRVRIERLLVDVDGDGDA